MPTVKIEVGGNSKKLEFTEQLGKGVYVVSGKNEVKRNCKELQIRLEINSGLSVKESQFNGLQVITKYFPGNYLQYLVLDTATDEMVELLKRITYQDFPEASISPNNLIQQLNDRLKNEH